MNRVTIEGEGPTLVNKGRPKRPDGKGPDPWKPELVVEGGAPENFPPGSKLLTKRPKKPSDEGEDTEDPRPWAWTDH